MGKLGNYPQQKVYFVLSTSVSTLLELTPLFKRLHRCKAFVAGLVCTRLFKFVVNSVGLDIF